MPKLNIICNNNYINGYINICSYQIPEHPDVRTGNIFNVDWIVDNGELDELLADKVIEYCPYEQVDTTFSNWVSKLQIGGKLIIGILDIYELSRLLNLRILTIDQYNTIVHKPVDSKLQKSSSLHTQLVIDKITKPHGFKLIDHTLKGADSTLTFERVR